MNPLFIDIISTWVRAALLIISGWLISHHVVTQGQGESLSTYLFDQVINFLPGLVALLWSMWDKYGWRKLVNTAAAMPAGTSVAAAIEMSKSTAAPPASLPTEVKPYLNTVNKEQ